MNSSGQRLLKFFNQLTVHNVDSADQIYAPDVHFKDPLHEYHSLNELKAYLTYQYKNTLNCQFECISETVEHSTCVVEWQMRFCHKALKFGQEIEVPGISILREDPNSKLIVFHRDYFDISAFIYENLPGIGAVVRAFKKRI